MIVIPDTSALVELIRGTEKGKLFSRFSTNQSW